MEERRKKKLGHLVMKEVEEIIRKHVSDPDIGFFTITHVAVSPDMKSAKVSVSVMGSPEEQKRSFDALVNSTGYIQHKLARQMATKYTPRITFVYDDRTEFRVEKLLSELKKENNGNDFEKQD